MTKHTPAPWTVDNTCPYSNEYEICIHKDDFHIAQTFGMGGEEKDNARLIAAAPELLEAAQKALDECVDLIGTDEGKALEAAVKKALGEQ